MKRARVISKQLRPYDAIGEKDAVDTDISKGRSNGKYIRKVIKIAFQDHSIADERYGGTGDTVVLEGELLRPPEGSSDTALIFMHPSGIMNMLPLPVALAKSGLHVVTACSRFPNNDSALIMEKCLVDLGICTSQSLCADVDVSSLQGHT